MENWMNIELNQEQETVVKNMENHMLIKGVSGSGKTFTYASRIAYLHKEQGIPAEQILNLCMDKAYAQKIHTAYQNLDDSEDVQFISIYTFAYRIVKEFNLKKGKAMRKPIRDLSMMIKRIAQQKFNLTLREPQLREVVQQIAYAKVMLLQPQEIELKEVFGMPLSAWIKAYDYEKRRKQVMDFEDVVVEALHVLLEQDSIKEAYKENLRYLHVDQGEDLSFAAHLLIKALLHEDLQVVMFTDSYTHRSGYGAYPESFDSYATVYHNADIYEWTKSYTLHDDQIAHVKKILSEIVMQGNDTTSNELICKGFKDIERLYAYATKQSLQEEAVTFTYMDSAYALPLLDELEKRQLSYGCHDNVHRFFQDDMTKELLAIMQLLLHPKETIYFTQCYQALSLDITERIMAEISEAMEADDMDVFEAMIRSSLKSTRKKELMSQMELIRMLPDKDTSTIFQAILTQLKYKLRLKALRVTKYDSNFLIFLYMCQKYDDPQTFVTRMDELSKLQFAHHGKIQLLPLTQVKNRMFDHLVVLDCIEHHFPSHKENTLYGKDERSLFINALTHARTLELCGFKAVQSIPCAISSFVFDVHRTKKEETTHVIKTVRSIQKVSECHLKPKTHILHETLGEGVIKKVKDGMMEVAFASEELRNLNIKFCLSNDLIKLV